MKTEGFISLRAARVNADLTRKQIADIIGVSEGTIKNWENGVTKPDYCQASKIAELGHIPYSFLCLDA